MHLFEFSGSAGPTENVPN